MKWIIDRFEEDTAIIELENDTTIALPRSIFPENAREGDLYELQFLEEETLARRQNLKSRLNALFRK